MTQKSNSTVGGISASEAPLNKGKNLSLIITDDVSLNSELIKLFYRDSSGWYLLSADCYQTLGSVHD